MADTLYADIRREFEQKRRAAERDARARRAEIYRDFPALAELERQISLKASEYSMRIVNGEPVQNEMDDELEKLSQKRERMLRENGIAPFMLNPIYECEKCRDTGVADGGYCSCFKKRVIEEHFKNSNIGSSLENQSFENFDISLFSSEKTGDFPLSPRENMERNRDICIRFADNFDTVEKSLLFLGGTGLGKTYLSTCIARRLLSGGKSVVYIGSVDFFGRIERARFDSASVDAEHFEQCDLLIIDDLGAECPSAYATGVFSDIIDKRIRLGAKMILSSNCRMSDLEKLYGQRVFSRIAGGFDCLLFYGGDLRIQKFMNGDNAR